MKEKISASIFLILLFFLFLFATNNKSRMHDFKVLKVVEADKFYLDINNDNLIQDNELFKLQDISAFCPILSNYSRNESEKLNISQLQYLKAGFLARKWAKDHLEGNFVSVKSIKECKNKNIAHYFCDIDFQGINLIIFYLKNGLAYIKEDCKNPKYVQYQSLMQARKNADELSKIDFLILNLKNNKIHKPDCEFVRNIAYGKIVSKKQLNDSKVHFCNFCFKEDEPEKFKKDDHIFHSKGIYRKSFYKKFDFIELYFINPLEYSKPDASCKTAICKRIVNEIDSSKVSIDIALYNFGDQKTIFDALKRAKQKGIKIRCVSDFSNSSEFDSSYNKYFEEEFHPTKDSKNSLMHNKFFIFDNKKVLTGSMNISSTGCGGYNSNLVLIVDDINFAKAYLREFELMYKGKFSTTKESFLFKPILRNNSKLTVAFCPQDNPFDTIILPMLKNAKKELFVSVFYLTERKFISELINAKNRGVSVIVLVDAVYANNFKNRVKQLRDSGVAVMVENWGGKNHEKTVMVDSKYLLLGSSNFSKSGFYKNDENIVLIENKDIASLYKDYFLYLLNSIDKKYLKFIPRSEGIDSINSCSDGIDNNFDGKIDWEDEGCKKSKAVFK